MKRLFIFIFFISSFIFSQTKPKIVVSVGAENEKIPICITDTIKTNYHSGLIKKEIFKNDNFLTINEYRKDGTLMRNSVYPLNNLKYKILTKYNRKGYIILIANYKNGIVDGYFSKFHNDGTPMEIGVYKMMKKINVWKYYDERGRLINVINYQN